MIPPVKAGFNATIERFWGWGFFRAIKLQTTMHTVDWEIYMLHKDHIFIFLYNHSFIWKIFDVDFKFQDSFYNYI